MHPAKQPQPGSPSRAPVTASSNPLATAAENYRSLLRKRHFSSTGTKQELDVLCQSVTSDFGRTNPNQRGIGDSKAPGVAGTATPPSGNSLEARSAGLVPDVVAVSESNESQPASAQGEGVFVASKAAAVPKEPATTPPIQRDSDALRFGLTEFAPPGTEVKDSIALKRVFEAFSAVEALYGVKLEPPRIGIDNTVWTRHTQGKVSSIAAASFFFYEFVEALRRDKQLQATGEINNFTKGVAERIGMLLFGRADYVIADSLAAKYNSEFHEYCDPSRASADSRIRPTSFRIMTLDGKVSQKSYVVPDVIPQSSGDGG